MVEEKLEIIQAFPGLEALDRLKKRWGRWSPGFIEEKISPEEEELECAMQVSSSCRGTGEGQLTPKWRLVRVRLVP